MPQFPEVDPNTLAEAIKSNLRSQMNIPALQNGGSANYNMVVQAWADALTATQNPSNAYFNSQINTIYGQLGQQGAAVTPTLLFNTSGTINVGEWVYISGNDTVSVASNASYATGPVVGVVTSLPSPTTARVQNVGSFVYTENLGMSFIPLIPDTVYYIGTAGQLTTNPTPPSGGYVQELGYAKSAYEFVITIQEPVQV
jgi:hypothetical protein